MGRPIGSKGKNSIKIEIICKNCNKKFLNYSSNKRIYCSKLCYVISITGKKLSDIHKAKIRLNHAKIWLGKKRPVSTCLKISLKHKGNRHSPVTEFKKGGYAGKNHYNWQGGITPLSEQIRKIEEYKNWRKLIFIRDNFTCQECFKIGGRLHSHHKNKSFAIILQEFLQQYSQFSPIDDKEILVRLAITYDPFWNINNGITLCKNCHKNARQKLLIS